MNVYEGVVSGSALQDQGDLRGLGAGETIALHVRGKLKGYIVPADQGKATIKAEDHPFFGSRADDKEDVTAIMERLRASRHHAL